MNTEEEAVPQQNNANNQNVVENPAQGTARRPDIYKDVQEAAEVVHILRNEKIVEMIIEKHIDTALSEQTSTDQQGKEERPGFSSSCDGLF